MIRTLAVLATVLTATSTAIAAPVASAEVSRAALACRGSVYGFTPEGTLVVRSVKNTTVTSERTSAEYVTFGPKSAAYVYGESIDETSGANYIATVNSDGIERTIKAVMHSDNDEIELDAKKMVAPERFDSRLVAGSGDFDYYIVDSHGVLRRWTIYETSSKRLVWKEPILLRKKMGKLKTLTFQVRHKFDGQKKDVLWGTTRSGALLQIQVPVAKPTKLAVHVVKKSGYKKVTGLSGMGCRKAPTTASLVVVESGQDRARWVTVRNQGAPKASNVIDHGRVAADLAWKLNAVF